MTAARAITLTAALAAMTGGAAADDAARQQMMSAMEYVDAQQCFIAVNSNVVSVMPVLALAWLKADNADGRNKARNAFDVALARGCDINAADFAGLTPLNQAVFANDADIVRYLLEHGADPGLTIESRDAVINGLNSHTLLDTLEKLDDSVNRQAVRNALDSRKTQ